MTDSFRTARLLRQERPGLLRHWQTQARARLWHLDEAHFARNGAATQAVDTALALVVQFADRRADLGDPPPAAESAPSESASVDFVEEPEGSEDDSTEVSLPEPVAAAAPPSVFDAVLSPMTECARVIAALPVAWGDIHTMLTLLADEIRRTMRNHRTDDDTLAVLDGLVAMLTTQVANLCTTQMERELAESREEAVVTQHLAGRFLANASHELRTPLTAVLGFAELLNEETYGPLTPEQAQAISHIDNSAQNLLEIVNNLLDLLHIRTGKLKLKYKLLPLAPILENLCGILTPLANRKQVTFTMELADDLGSMEADENVLRHIVYHLLSSSLRATPAGGEVRLKATRGGDSILLEARDTALHLPPEAVANMMEPFPRLENSPARGYEGWEVGLPLVHRYVTLHRGAMRLESLPETGTVFEIELPLSRTSPVPAPPAETAFE